MMYVIINFFFVSDADVTTNYLLVLLTTCTKDSSFIIIIFLIFLSALQMEAYNLFKLEVKQTAPLFFVEHLNRWWWKCVGMLSIAPTPRSFWQRAAIVLVSISATNCLLATMQENVHVFSCVVFFSFLFGVIVL